MKLLRSNMSEESLPVGSRILFPGYLSCVVLSQKMCRKTGCTGWKGDFDVLSL